MKCSWNADYQRSFEGIKQRLMQSPILVIADKDKTFCVVCNSSDFAIGCALKHLIQTAQSASKIISRASCKQLSVTNQCVTRNF